LFRKYDTDNDGRLSRGEVKDFIKETIRHRNDSISDEQIESYV